MGDAKNVDEICILLFVRKKSPKHCKEERGKKGKKKRQRMCVCLEAGCPARCRGGRCWGVHRASTERPMQTSLQTKRTKENRNIISKGKKRGKVFALIFSVVFTARKICEQQNHYISHNAKSAEVKKRWDEESENGNDLCTLRTRLHAPQ